MLTHWKKEGFLHVHEFTGKWYAIENVNPTFKPFLCHVADKQHLSKNMHDCSATYMFFHQIMKIVTITYYKELLDMTNNFSHESKYIFIFCYNGVKFIMYLIMNSLP